MQFMRSFRTPAFAVALSAIATACATSPGMQTEPVMDTQPAAAAISDGGAAEIVRTANTGKIEQGQLAVSKATIASVRGFAERMVADHTQANRRLDELLQQENLTAAQAPMAAELRQNMATTMETLRSLEGEAFDRAYIENQIAQHEQLLRALDETLLPAAQSNALEAYLQTLRGSVAEHLESARQIRTSMGG